MSSTNSNNVAAQGMRTLRTYKLASALLALSLLPSPALLAQSRKLPNVHYFMDASHEPGVVAHSQIARGVPGVGSFQALEVSGPPGLKIALARDGQFLHTLDAPVKVGMIVGAVYRIRVTGIPYAPGEELYPSIEVIDRINAPQGREHRFPIPIVLEEGDLRQALEGALVTRVIYLEDGEIADPVAVKPGAQRVLDVGPMDNALKAADQLGKPVAILRIGSRVPSNLQGDLSDFLYGCPPWIPVSPIPTRQGLVEKGMWPESMPAEYDQDPRSEKPGIAEPRVPR
jgi:hypothetical protein